MRGGEEVGEGGGEDEEGPGLSSCNSGSGLNSGRFRIGEFNSGSGIDMITRGAICGLLNIFTYLFTMKLTTHKKKKYQFLEGNFNKFLVKNEIL